MTLVDGQTIVISNYFADTNSGNHLYLSADGEISEVLISPSGNGPLYADYGPIEGWDKWSPLDDLRFATSDPVTEQLIAEYRAANSITPRKISDAEVIERCIYALVNEGARILEEGIAARASDIDIAYLNGYGFPLHRGGPMLYADLAGLPNVVRALRRFAAEPGADASWQPAPLLLRLADEGKTFC